MKTGLNFLIAARQCEMADLQQLAHTSGLVQATARLVHELQRERGLSNLYLGSGGERFGSARQEQTLLTTEAETDLRACFDALSLETGRPSHGARLFSRIACALHGLDALTLLRQRVLTMEWSMERTIGCYMRLIAGLLSVVYEAADTASDPVISRLLVALFNFMQGKEYAGQERAQGAAMYAVGIAQATGQQRILELIDAQERCLKVFADFSTAQARAHWDESQQPGTLAELERMRRVLCTAPDGAQLNTDLCEVWFGCCSRRMNEMKAVEDLLMQELQTRCQDQLSVAGAELQALQDLQTALPTRTQTAQALKAAESFFSEQGEAVSDAPPRQTLASPLERSILELVQEQARRLQNVQDELDTVRASLNERKVIERAKGLLMAHKQMSEADAHKTMRQMAMSQNRRLLDVADAVLTMAEVLPTAHLH